MAKKTFNHFRRREGHFNLLSPDERQACYDFFLREDAPKDLRTSYTIPLKYDPWLDPDEWMALDAARELLKAYDTYYLFTTKKTDLEKLIAYLETVEEQDLRDYLRYEVARAEEKAEQARRRAEQYRKQLEALESGVRLR